MIIPNTKLHPNNTKTDQLPISEVITGLPRPYHNTSQNEVVWVTHIRKGNTQKKKHAGRVETSNAREVRIGWWMGTQQNIWIDHIFVLYTAAIPLYD